MGKIEKSGIGEKIKVLWEEGYGGDKIAGLTGNVVTGRSVMRFLNREGIPTHLKKVRLVKCLECGKEFEKKRHCYLKSSKHFCCMPCYWEHLKNPNYVRAIYGTRIARQVVRECGHIFSPGEVVHHIDSDNNNNDPKNLMVFESNGDHTRWHRSEHLQSGVVPIWPASEKFPKNVVEKATLAVKKDKAKENKAYREQKVSSGDMAEDELLAANERLKKRQAEYKKVKTPKGPVKVNTAMSNFFNPQPKGKK